MKKYFIILGILFSTINLLAQTDSIPNSSNDKIVTITVTGQGKTIDEAKTNALRSAIEQAFGAFISSNTTILNDSLVKDEIVSVTNGNIQKYDVLNEIALPNGSYLITLKAIVSVSKLTSYCESKGVKVEFEGGLFSYNIKLQILNEESEIKAIKELTQSVFRILQQSFDYSVKMSPPLSLDNENKKWKISLSITATTNNNINLLSEMLFKTLSSISLKSISEYRSIGKSVYPIYFYYKGEKKAFYLRKEQSLKILESLFNNKVWMYCLSSFQINNGFEKQQRVGIANPKMWHYHYECSFDEMYNDAPSKGLRGEMINPGDAHSIVTRLAYLFTRDKTYRVFLLEPSRVAAIFSFDDVKDISEIEKIKEYVVTSLDIKISDYDVISN